MPYQLPTDPAVPSDDALGVLDVDDAYQAQVLDTLLQTAVTRLSEQTVVDLLPSLLEDVAYAVHGNGKLDTQNLRDYLRSRSRPSFQTIVALVSAARSLSRVLPDNSLDVLKLHGDTVTYNGGQVNALLGHQFLSTLARPEGTDWGLPCFMDWFASDPAHPHAVHGYLTTIFRHFAQGGYPDAYNFTFACHTAEDMPDPSQCDIIPDIHLHTTVEEFEPSNDPNEPFILVAAHSQPGPGATGTQEERLQSASPALSISALVSPRLPDNAAVVTSSFPVHAAWKGHNRKARLANLFEVHERPRRHYILADALPLDEIEETEGMLNDLHNGNVAREIKKLYAAFSGAVKMHKLSGNSESCIVETGAWGCGAFGGNVLVKSICMMVAAGLTGVAVSMTSLKSREGDVALVHALIAKRYTTTELWKLATATNNLPGLITALRLDGSLLPPS